MRGGGVLVIIVIDTFQRDLIQFYSLPALFPSLSPKHHVRPTCCANQTTFTARRASSDAVKCQRERRVCCKSLHISLTWAPSCQKSKKSKIQKTAKANQRGRWEPFRAKVSAERSGARTASAAAPWVHSARPASPSQPYSSSPHQSVKVSQLIL